MVECTFETAFPNSALAASYEKKLSDHECEGQLGCRPQLREFLVCQSEDRKKHCLTLAMCRGIIIPLNHLFYYSEWAQVGVPVARRCSGAFEGWRYVSWSARCRDVDHQRHRGVRPVSNVFHSIADLNSPEVLKLRPVLRRPTAGTPPSSPS